MDPARLLPKLRLELDFQAVVRGAGNCNIQLEGWQSGQLRGSRKPEGVIPTQVRILYPPQVIHYMTRSLPL